MSNMSYCRFENTLHDLGDCRNHLSDTDLSREEKKCRRRLLEECVGILEDLGFSIESGEDYDDVEEAADALDLEEEEEDDEEEESDDTVRHNGWPGHG